MKNNNFIKMLFTLAFGLFMISCSSDDEPSTNANSLNDELNTNEKVIASFEQTIDGDTFSASFNYNENKELEMVTSSFGNLTFDFSEGRIIKVSEQFGYTEYDYNDNGMLTESREYLDRNEDGNIKLRYAHEYTYNSNNQVIKIEEFDYNESGEADTWSYYDEYIYEDNISANPKSSKYYAHQTGQDATLISERTYDFDSSENPFYMSGVNQFFVTNDWVPVFATNNLMNSETTSVNGLEDNSISLDNEYDDEGDLLKATVTISWPGNDDFIYSVAFTYKTI